MAFRRHWLITAIITVAAVASAAYVGLHRPPVYTARSQMNVGQVGVPSTVSGSYVQAVQSLTVTYSRAATSALVLGPVAQARGSSVEEIQSRVSATPVPLSAIVAVSATGASERSAVALANAVAAQLVKFSSSQNSDSPVMKSLLRRIARATAKQSAAIRSLGTIQRTYSGDQSRENGRRLDEAHARVGAARVRVQTLIAQLDQLKSGGATGPALTVISPAVSAQSDKQSVLERLLAIGLIGGLAIGTLLAAGMDAVRRRVTHASRV